MRGRIFLIATAFLGLVLIPVVGKASPPVLLTQFNLHDFDRRIVAALGYDTNAAVIYFDEIASVTPQQSEAIKLYEPIGCFPFYVLREGVVQESGFNCESYFCVGFSKGPKQCRDNAGKAYGGVVEMNNRLSLVTLQDTRKFFGDYALADQTTYMKRKIKELGVLHCKPYYLLRFDIAVGEGHECTEIGQFPYYSGNFRCTVDWRSEDHPESCTVAVREDELAIRRQILGIEGEDLTTETTGSGAVRTDFSDVLSGYYGYTAITSLANRGIIQGYADGTYKPSQNVNRAEFSKLLVSVLQPDAIRGEENCFPDVKNDWYSPYVCAAKRLGWLSGYPDGTFRPTKTMLKAEGIKVVIASLGLNLDSATPLPVGVPDDQWYSQYVRRGVDAHILLEPAFTPTNTVTRADAAVWLYRSLKGLGRLSSSSSSSSAQ